MCLTRLEKFKTRGVGWKCVKISTKGNIHPICKHGRMKFHAKKWNKDVEKGNILNLYPRGFHISNLKKDALTWTRHGITGRHIKKVEYRKVVATGYLWSEKVVVAKEFRFID